MTNHRKASKTIDGVGVAYNKARVSGQFELEDVDADNSTFDRRSVGLVFYRVLPPTYRENKNGDLERIAVLKPLEFRMVADNKRGQELLTEFDFENQFLAEEVEEGSEVETSEKEVPVTFAPVEIEEGPGVEQIDPEESEAVEMPVGDEADMDYSQFSKPPFNTSVFDLKQFMEA